MMPKMRMMMQRRAMMLRWEMPTGTMSESAATTKNFLPTILLKFYAHVENFLLIPRQLAFIII